MRHAQWLARFGGTSQSEQRTTARQIEVRHIRVAAVTGRELPALLLRGRQRLDCIASRERDPRQRAIMDRFMIEASPSCSA